MRTRCSGRRWADSPYSPCLAPPTPPHLPRCLPSSPCLRPPPPRLPASLRLQWGPQGVTLGGKTYRLTRVHFFPIDGHEGAEDGGES